MSVLINRRDLEFLLYEMLDVTSLCSHERYKEHDRQTFDAVLETTEQIAEEEFLTHAAKLDENEPQFDGERVHIIQDVKQALDVYRDAGFLGASFDRDYGGLQLPLVINQSCLAVFAAANVGTVGYGVLTVAAANMLNAFGSATQKQIFLQPLLEGRFFGTMCMSEPHAGSSLTDILTKAKPQADGTYKFTGTKMWISGGEHDLSENIVHMVLAKIPGSPPGVKGISLFIVPKFLVNADRSLGQRNDVTLAGLNHKMGWRGTVNTVLNFGEKDECQGYLLGEPNKGLSYMFHMLNEARIAVGLEATSLGYSGYLYSLDYARNRLQGRHPDEKAPDKPQIPIINHADVRRMLLLQKSYVEGALSLLLFCALLQDLQRVTTDENKKKDISLLLDLLTPIAKSWPSEFCLEANKLAIQVLGGYGYTRDYPVERMYRDNRLNAIHDGTTGMQALDLLGRKVIMHDGRAFDLLLNRIAGTIAETESLQALDEFRRQLQSLADAAKATTETLREAAKRGETRRFLANSTIYLEMLGHVVIAWMWLQQGAVALRQIGERGTDESGFYNGKLRALRFFYRYELPKIYAQADLLQSLDETCLEVTDSEF